MKKIGADAILIAMVAPIVAWLISLLISFYDVRAQVSDEKTDIQEIKTDVKYIKSFLMEHPIEKPSR
jgi:hypothetical protein